MVNSALHRSGTLERFLPPAVLFVLLVFSVAKFIVIPYVGFYYNPENGIVSHIYVESPTGEGLELGDMITKVGSVTQQSAYEDLRQPLLADVVYGEPLDIEIIRDGRPMTITWVPPGPNSVELFNRLIDIWWLAYIFWIAGTFTILMIRPKDKRWLLLVAFNYLTSIWLIAGVVSASHLWESSIVLHMTICLSMPVYFHLHWVFPQPLWRLPRFVWVGLYGVGIMGAIAEFFQLVPIHTYLLAAAVAFLTPLLLLIGRLFSRAQRTKELWIIFIGFFVALSPVLWLVMQGIVADLPSAGALSLLSFPALPIAYFYAASRRQPGWLVSRTNRLVVRYIFFFPFIVLGIVVGVLLNRLGLSQVFGLASGLIVLGTGLLTLYGFVPAQRFIERRLLRMPQAPQALPAAYIAHITTSLDIQTLTNVIQEEILPSLLIREAVLFYAPAEPQMFEPLVTFGLADGQIPDSAKLAEIRPYVEQEQFILPEPIDWIYVALPLRLEGELKGLWLLGKRDPDDFYPTADLEILKQLAAQTAIALTNISQSEQLRAFYQANIVRQEAERANLARFLHDDVLNELAVFKTSQDGLAQLPQYDALITRIRHEVIGLRPALLTYGLWNAFEDLVDNIAQRDPSSQTRIGLLIPPTAVRYPAEVEEHLFRVVQQALENAVKYAAAKNIVLGGQLLPSQVRLTVNDDGRGFAVAQPLKLTTFLAQNRFGLAGMYERCALIKADLQIASTPEQGTQVLVMWRGAEDNHHE